ncbi:hypothetical protein CONCODRAFT_76686 [Conidiobolus coronatus NRRL 28638]|uniref:GYF domain-containing protein n=1 Tax=Conidiobolus coronatus (strain ATCC 28846 / CBS 209.66 / NRRL 28638) TaxID=796925 RepID=A0A137PIK2_CONC2|nr:hypothetical protein CONCODRAFT_76686 [Conidiobolus coronatus NRRL 28638]|eukprot:KXN74815.1 hypothetical protein CONCODRAFT_76686 [Conidiobolus coronatus NRRL 28638]
MSLRRSREFDESNVGPSSRKVRFNDNVRNRSDSDDEEDLERRKKRHGEVNLDGYGSQDSLDEESDDDKSEKDNEEEEDDMFAEAKPEKKETEQFIGQELDSREGFEHSEGIQIEAFNMKGDMELGNFDENDNFVWKQKDENSHHDSWMNGISRQEMEKAKKAQEKKERKSMEQAQKSDKKSSFQKSSDIKLELIKLMKPGETILSVLSRLKVKKPKFNTSKKSKAAESESSEDIEEKKKTIEKITELTEKLIDKGELDIYSARFEDLARTLKNERVLSATWKHGDPTDKQSQTLYEYKWKEVDEVYGPYSYHDMVQWNQQGYFEAGILIRQFESGDSFKAPEDEFFKNQ